MTAPPVWVTELVERFWTSAGAPPPFPRDLTNSATNALPLSMISRPNLALNTVTDLLRGMRLPVPTLGPDRPLRAALFCWRGNGFVFIDSDDPPDERRFSLAHELAHFLRDCDDLRRQLRRALGPAALDVLDGRRAVTHDDRIHAFLRNVSLTPHVHFMRRDAAGRPAGDDEREAEARADRLAFELLAPAALLIDKTNPASLVVRLVTEFGLPPSAARSYADHLIPSDKSPDALLALLGKFR